MVALHEEISHIDINVFFAKDRDYSVWLIRYMLIFYDSEPFAPIRCLEPLTCHTIL